LLPQSRGRSQSKATYKKTLHGIPPVHAREG
jgi:hypothetical protein